MIRMIAVDLDGTLMDSRNQIDIKTIAMLQNAIYKGIYVVPATGRCLGVLPEQLSVLIGMRYAITENGALIWDYQEEAEWRRFPLPPMQTEVILKLVRGMAVYAEIFLHGQAYADIRSLEGIDQTLLGTNFIRYFTENHNFRTQLSKEHELLAEAEKINLYFENNCDSAQIRGILETNPTICVSSSVGNNVEITNIGVDKGQALTELSKMLGIKQDEILVFGDNENDIGMFGSAGIAVAMGNAKIKIKQAADWVTGTNDELGVALFLENYLKL